jgi:hypothetical protein
MKNEDRFLIVGLYLFNLGTVSIARADISNPFEVISCVFGIIIGGLCVCYSLGFNK